MKFSSLLLHEGYKPEEVYGSVMPPLYLTSTYAQRDPGVHNGYDYTRAGNPNFTFLENLLAPLENAEYATVFSSGLAATTAILTSICQSGDRVVALSGLYGGTWRLFFHIFEKFGVQFEIVSIDAIEEALANQPKILFFETPTNPLLEIRDIGKFCRLAKDNHTLAVVDNTFATPYLQNPLDLGADIVLHSTTKYIGGHSDHIGGALITNNRTLKEGFDFSRMSLGLHPSPMEAWLAMRGVRTLALRMQKCQKNALELAHFLEEGSTVKKVYYPGLPSHPQHELAKRQMRGFGGMLSAEFDFSYDEVQSMISSLKLFTLAESLGGVESLICHPASMTHASIPKKEREKMGVSEGLLRFSIGIEDAEDLKQDINGIFNKG